MERLVKGFSNHRRVEILYLLDKKPELSVFDVARELDVDFRTISEHIRRMAVAGLVIKRFEGKNVRHKLTERGKVILTLRPNVGMTFRGGVGSDTERRFG